MQTNPQDLVSWVVKGGVYKGELNLELQKKAPVAADLLYTIKVGGQKGILHVEFQSTHHKRMDRRVWEYNCLASVHTGLPVGYLFSAYTFTKEDELQWLKERFTKMKDLLEDNWAYREMVQWAEEKALKQGLEQGLEQGMYKELQALRTTLLRFVETHFPDQFAFAKQQVELTTTPLQVQDLLDKLFVARTGDEVRKVLLAIPHA